jgi:hypothetical protein
MNRTAALAIRRHVEVHHNNAYSTVERNKVRLHRDGTVSAYGRMPNSIVTGWWLVGTQTDILAEIKEACRASR